MKGNTGHRRRPLWALSAAVFTLALVAAACGSDDEDATDNGAATTDTAQTDSEAGNGEAAEGEWELVESSTPAMLAALDTAITNEDPIVVTLWTPHWAYDAYPIKNLEDPEGAWGDPEEIHALGRPGFSDDHPEVAGFLESWEMPEDALAELSYLVIEEYDDGQEMEAVEEWLGEGENASLVNEWIGTDGDELNVPELSGSIEIGWIPWDEAVAVTNMWAYVLEEGGMEVEVGSPLEVGPLYSALASGDIDLFLDSWLPVTHEDYMEEFGEELEDLGIWFEEATLELAVPEYMDVDSIADLNEVGEDVDWEIIGIEAGAGLTRLTLDEIMPTYNLNGDG